MRKREVLCCCISNLIGLISCFTLLTSSTFAIYAGESSYEIIIPDTNENTEMIVTESESKLELDFKIYEEAEKIVKKFIEPYSKYISPKKVFFGKIYSDEVYGFQVDKQIYVDDSREKSEILATIVHELLHLQNPIGFDTKIEVGCIIGHNLTEAVIESITCNLTGQPETKRVELLCSYTSNTTRQIMLEAFCRKNQSLLDEYLDDEKKYRVSFQDEMLLVSPSDYFKISFDKWMIIDQEEKGIFDKLRDEEEL